MTAATTSVIKTVNESRYDETAGYLDDAELMLSLDASTSYWVEMMLLTRVTNSGATRLYGRMAYSGTLDDTYTHIFGQSNYSYWPNGLKAGSSFCKYYLTQAALTDGLYNINGSGNDTNMRSAIWLSGRIATTTSGLLKWQWEHTDNGVVGSAYPSVVYKGSFIYVTPLDVCPI